MGKRSKKLNPSRIIAQVEEDELLLFVRQYAEKDTDFLYRMWVKFATKVEFEDERDKYEYLFFKILHQYLPSSTNPTKKRIRQIKRLYGELGQHAEDAVGMERYQEAFYIIRPGIVYGKLALKRSKSKDEEEKLLDLYLHYHRLLGRLINQLLPPPLIDKISTFCVNESLVYDYYLADSEFNLFDLGFRVIYDRKAARSYLEKIESSFEEIQKNSASPYYIKEIAVREAYRWDSLDLWKKWVESSFLKPEEIAQLALSFKAKGLHDLSYKFAFEMAEKAGKMPKSRLLQTIIELWEPDKSVKQFESVLNQYVQLEPRVNHLYKMLTDKQFSSKDFTRFFKSVEKHLAAESSRQKYYEWLILDRQYDKLIDQIEKGGESRFLVEQLHRLPAQKQQAALSLVNSWLEEKLRSSYGKQGSNLVEEVTESLRKQDLGHLADEVIGHVKSAFPRRKSFQGVI